MEKEQKLTNQQKLEKIIFDLSSICAALQNSKKDAKEQTSETRKLLEQFNVLIDDLEQTKNKLTKDVLGKIHEGAASGCTTAIENLLEATIKEKINVPINSLQQAVNASKKQIEACTKKSIFADWTGHLLGFGISLGVSLLVSVAVIKVFIPASSLSLSAELVDTYYYGTILKNVFSKMKKEESIKLENMLGLTMFELAAAREKLHKKYPNLSEEEVDSMARKELLQK